jgi:hypothetical protein
MIEALQEMPPGVTGVRVSGRVSGEELREFRLTRPGKSGDCTV